MQFFNIFCELKKKLANHQLKAEITHIVFVNDVINNQKLRKILCSKQIKRSS